MRKREIGINFKFDLLRGEELASGRNKNLRDSVRERNREKEI